MKYFITGLFVVSQLFLLGQSKQEQVNQLLHKKANLERSILSAQREIKMIDAQITELQKVQTQPIIVSESGQKIVATLTNQDAILHESPNNQSPKVLTIPANATIYVHHEYKGMYLKTTYYGKDGWLNYNNIKTHPEIDALIKNKSLPKTTITTTVTSTKTTVVTLDQNSPKYKRLAKLYGPEKAVRIINRELWKGMSHGQVRESLGKPNSQSQENTDKGLKEEWIYPNQKLIFKNGVLFSW